MNTKALKISIIITSYNYEGFIDEAINSVLEQGYSYKELIVVDDCSTDNSQNVINAFGNKLIAVLKDINEGQGAAFNSGYEKATGDLILFLDADDYLYPGSLQKIIDNYVESSSLYQYRMGLVDAEGKQFGVFPSESQPWNAGKAEANVLRYGRYQTAVTSSMVYSKSFLDSVMPMDAESFKYGADGYVAILAPLYGQVIGSNELLSAYRQHGGNHSGFTSQVVKQAHWGVEHDTERYKALTLHAKRLGLDVEVSYAETDLYHLQSRMCLALFDPTVSENRWYLFSKMLSSLSMIKGRKLKIVLASWWISLLLPRVISKQLYLWKAVPASRPWRASK